MLLKVKYGPRIDYRFCDGCKICYDDCPMDVFGWDDEKRMPTVAYPYECHFCGICELGCPKIAIDVELPIHAKVDVGIYPEK